MFSRWDRVNQSFCTYKWKTFHRNCSCSHQGNKLYSETSWSSLMSQLASSSHSVPHLKNHIACHRYSGRKTGLTRSLKEPFLYSVHYSPRNWEDVTLKQCAVLCYMEFLFRHKLHVHWVCHDNSMYTYLYDNPIRVMGDSAVSNNNQLLFCVGSATFEYSFWDVSESFTR